MININAIFDWYSTNSKRINFVEGERRLKAGHFIYHGKDKDKSERSNAVNFTAYCSKTSKLKEDSHEINGELTKSGDISSIKCTCKAGLGAKCKHMIPTLLYCDW